MARLDAIFETIRARSIEIAETNRTSIAMRQLYLSRAAPIDPRLRDQIEAQARRLGLSILRMPGGAQHDAQSVARLAPVGMIFVLSGGDR